MNPDVIRQRKVDRQTVLAACYRICDGSTDTGFDVDEVVKVTGLERDRASSAISYLCDAGLIRQFTVVYYLLTPAGVDAVEDAIQQDDSGGEASPFIQQVFHGPVGVVQNAASGTAHVEMSTASSSRLAKMVQPIHFEDFSGEQFERLTLAYHLRIEPDTPWEWYGQVGSDLGRDIIGVRAPGDVVCVQCVNRAALTSSKGTRDLDKAASAPGGIPTLFRFVCRSDVSADMRDKLKGHASSLGVTTCEVWSGVEFEERLRRDAESLLMRFFQGVEFPDTPVELARIAKATGDRARAPRSPDELVFEALSAHADAMGHVTADWDELRLWVGPAAEAFDVHEVCIRLYQGGRFLGEPYFESGPQGRCSLTLRQQRS